MPPKKAPPLQAELETQGDFENFLKHEGLKVVDVYSEWCGPCKVITGLLRKVKLDLSDDKLHFAIAKTDTIDALAAYRGRSEPTFLFYGGHDLVGVVRGADGSALTAAITSQLKAEHQVLSGAAARAVFVDPGPAEPVFTKETAAKAPAAAPAGPKEHTLALILPVPLQEGMRDEIFAAIAEAGFKIAHQEDDRTISADDARTLLASYAEEPNFEQLVTDVSSGPVVALVLARAHAVQEWIDRLGPLDPDEAQLHPTCMRALYGAHGLHGSKSVADAEKEIAFLFPDWSATPKAPAAPEPAAEAPAAEASATEVSAAEAPAAEAAEHDKAPSAAALAVATGGEDPTAATTTAADEPAAEATTPAADEASPAADAAEPEPAAAAEVEPAAAETTAE